MELVPLGGLDSSSVLAQQFSRVLQLDRALALSDDVATMANQLSALATRAGNLPPHVPGRPSHPAHPAYYALNRAWRELADACDLLKGKEPKAEAFRDRRKGGR